MLTNEIPRQLTYGEAIRDAIVSSLERDDSVVVIGEGVPDPKGIFGTTLGLKSQFGERRIFDMPLSENGMTGVCIGAAISGLRPILIHQRLDFALLSLDQLINNAAKWSFMFAHSEGVPLVVRMIVGRGWGQGPQHSQSLQALFGQIPGLKVVMPSTPADAGGCMLAAVRDNNPVIFIEHRWLHTIVGEVPEPQQPVDLAAAKVKVSGSDVTIVSTSFATIQSITVAKKLNEYFGVSVEVLDLVSIRPIDRNAIKNSVDKTGKLVVFDTGYTTFGVGAEVISIASEDCWFSLKAAPRRIGLPDFPSPTAPLMTKDYYPTEFTLAINVLELIGKEITLELRRRVSDIFRSETPHDIPNPAYEGPF
jgi:pyruvate/2-oxoglutarate/acetoin dehydrogenase E1 component